MKKNILLIISSILVTLLVLEVLLARLGYQPIYSPDPVPVIVPVRDCNEIDGCQWLRECTMPAAYCEAYDYIPDSWFQYIGHAGPEWFMNSAKAEHTVLVTGDSFTAGASAPEGRGWVNQMYDHFENEDEFVLWQTGLGASGPPRAVRVLEYYLPLMQPDITILGFYTGNDLRDSLFPPGQFQLSKTARNGNVLVRMYGMDDNFEPYTLPPERIFYRARGLDAPPEELMQWFYSLRLGTVLSHALRPARTYEINDYLPYGITATRNYLVDIRDLAERYDTRLLVLVIPERDDLETPTAAYTASLQMLEELDIPYLTIRNRLTIADYASPPDTHWNLAGHTRAGNLMISCLQAILDSNMNSCSQLQ
jgi:hypothetical protein